MRAAKRAQRRWARTRRSRSLGRTLMRSTPPSPGAGGGCCWEEGRWCPDLNSIVGGVASQNKNPRFTTCARSPPSFLFRTLPANYVKLANCHVSLVGFETPDSALQVLAGSNLLYYLIFLGNFLLSMCI